MLFKVCVLGFVISACFAAELPSYIKPCSLSDKNFNTCLAKSAEEALPHVLKGDKVYKIPNLYPIELPLVEISLGDDVKMVFIDAKAYMFQGVKFTEASYDKDKQHLVLRFHNPLLNSKTKYEMNMKLFGVVISGKGPAVLNFTDVDMTYDVQLKTISKNGVEHFQVVNSGLTFLPTDGSFNFENLFNGEPTLGRATNELLNQNWRDFVGILEPTIKKIIGGLFDNNLNAYFKAVPKSGIFLP